MSWVLIALLAYFLLAIANIGDKFLVDNVLKSSKAYTFVVCFLGIIVFAAAPWFLEWPGLGLFLFNLVNGFLFALALWALYESLIRDEASRVLVLIGGVTPVFSLIFSVLIFGERFSFQQLLGIGIILIGVLLIAFLPQKKSLFKRFFAWLNIDNKINKGGLKIAIVSAFFYSLYFISTKIAYQYQSFESSFIWTRAGAFIFSIFFLLQKKDRQEILKMIKGSGPKKAKTLVILNQIAGSLGFVLQNYAVFLGSVVLVNALQGFQYALILIFSAFLSFLYPKLLKENFSKKVIIKKSLAIIFIALGIYFLTF